MMIHKILAFKAIDCLVSIIFGNESRRLQIQIPHENNLYEQSWRPQFLPHSEEFYLFF